MKNLNAARANTRQMKLKSFRLTNIISITPLIGQGETLTEAIQRRHLTESLEILEKYGFDGDLGILAIRQIQDFGRVAR